MYQSYDSKSDPARHPPRLAALRKMLAARDLDGFIVPRADAHQGEYVAARDARLAWLTGFTGSAGFCIVTPDRAGVFIDGRYRVQVKAEGNTSTVSVQNSQGAADNSDAARQIVTRLAEALR